MSDKTNSNPILNDQEWEQVNVRCGCDILDIVTNVAHGRASPAKTASLIADRCDVVAEVVAAKQQAESVRLRAELDAAKAVIEKLSPDALALAAEWGRVEEMKGDFYGITYNPFLNSGAGAWVCSFYATNRLLLVHTGPTPAAAIIAAHEAWQKEHGK